MGEALRIESPIKAILKKQLQIATLDEYLEKTLEAAGYGGVTANETPLGTRLTIYVLRAGMIIGHRGVGIKELTERLEKKFNFTNLQISVAEIPTPELNPRIMCQRMAQMIRRGTPFRRIALWALRSIMSANALGAEIVISGKLRSERASYQKFTKGIIPKSGELSRVAVLKAKTDVLLKAGIYGVKVTIAFREKLFGEFELKEEAG